MSVAAVIFAAGAGIALYDLLSSKGQSLTVSNTILSDMNVNAQFLSDTSCFSNTIGNQAVTIVGGPSSPDTYDVSQLNAPNGACTVCTQLLDSIVQAREALETDALTQSNGRYTPQQPSQAMATAMTGGQTSSLNQLGACSLMCSDIVVYGVQQSQSFTVTENCQVSDQVNNDISQIIQGQVSQSLTNQEDILGSIENAFTSNRQSITNNIATRMNETTTTSVRQTLANVIQSTQTISVGLGPTNNGNSHSIYVNVVEQSFNAKSTASLVVNNELNNTLRQSADYSISQTLLNKNDTIGDLVNSFLGIIDTVGGFVDTLTGQLLIIIGCMIAVFIIMVGSFYFFTQKGRELGDALINVAEAKAKEKIQAMKTQPTTFKGTVNSLLTSPTSTTVATPTTTDAIPVATPVT